MQHNNSIACTVTECKHHCKEDNFCTLNQIKVCKHGNTATSCECTDCDSFTRE